jgi:hypothetical protein
MIGVFDDDGTTRLAVAFNGLTINGITQSSAGLRSYDYGYTVEVAGLRTAMDYVSEPNQWADLMELYGMRKSSRIVVIRGFVKGRTISEVFDKVKALAAATDPSRIVFQNPTDYFLPLTFSTPTEDTSNFASGLAPSKYVGIPIRMAEPQMSVVGQGLAAPYELNLLLREPKRFLQSATAVSGAATTTNSIADDRSWPVLTFTLSGGAGSSSFTITNVATYQGTVSLVLDLSAYTTGNWTVNFRDKTIYQGTTIRYDVFKSGTYFTVEPGSNVISYTNTTNTSSRVLTYYPAFTL